MYGTNRTHGFAIVVVMLVSVVVLVGAVTAASLASLGTRANAADERVTYTAQLIAESGINSFNARAQHNPYIGELNASDLETWMSQPLPDGSTLRTVTLDSSSQATLSVADLDIYAERFTLRSDGTLTSAAGIQGTKTVLMDISIRKRAPDFRIPSALTSYGDIWAGGESSIRGSGESWDGLLDDITSTTSGVFLTPGQPFEIEVADAELIHRGQYVSINGETYRVEGRSDSIGGATLRLQPMNPASLALTIGAGTPIDLVYSGVTSSFPSSGDVTKLPVNDASKFFVGRKIYVDSAPNVFGQVTTFTGEVTALDTETDEVTISWVGTAPSESDGIPEGTPVRPDVNGASSADQIVEEACTPRPNNPCPDNIDTTDPYSPHVPSGDALFEQIFGMTKKEAKDQADYVGSTVPSPATGLTWINNSANLTADVLCGSGILIIAGDLTYNGTCPEGFDGVVYVMGNLDQQGNSILSGAMVVEGRTKVAGTGNHKIAWDPVAILKARRLVATWHIEPIAGTWRQR